MAKQSERKCQYCWRNWGITNRARKDSECWFHHYYQLCPEHGCVNCCEKAIRSQCA